MLPNSAHPMAANISGYGMTPTMGSADTCDDSAARNGRNAISVMTESTRLMPRPWTVPEKRIVSSWTRCEAPSMVRRRGQLAT